MNRCTTERVLDGLCELISAMLLDNYGPQCKAYREHQYPESLDPKQTPCVVVEQKSQTQVDGAINLLQEVTLIVKTMANEITATTVNSGNVTGPLVLPLLNETLARLDEILTDGNPNLGGVSVTCLTEDRPRAIEWGVDEALCEYPVGLRYARLAASQLGEE